MEQHSITKTLHFLSSFGGKLCICGMTSYFSGIDICWLIASFEPFYVIKLTVIELVTEHPYDFVEIYDGEFFVVDVVVHLDGA